MSKGTVMSARRTSAFEISTEGMAEHWFLNSVRPDKEVHYLV